MTEMESMEEEREITSGFQTMVFTRAYYPNTAMGIASDAVLVRRGYVKGSIRWNEYDGKWYAKFIRRDVNG